MSESSPGQQPASAGSEGSASRQPASSQPTSRQPASSQPASRQSASGQSASRQSAPRKLAEWVSMGFSALLILGLAAYLVLQALRPHPPYVVATARPVLQEVREEDGRYILPVQVSNGSRRTLRDLRVEVTFREDGKEEKRDFDIDYLSEGSQQRVYLYFDRHPRDLHVDARPVQYRLE